MCCDPLATHKVISQALEAREAQDVDFLRQIAMDRLDALHRALWPAAMAGDVPAVMALLRINDTRCRLLGLYEHRDRKKSPEDSWDNCYGPPTVVINPHDCRHNGCDRHGRFPQLLPVVGETSTTAHVETPPVQ